MKRVAVLCAVVAMAGCNQLPKNQANVQQVFVAAQAPVNGPVLAQVNDWKIGLDDFNARIDMLKQSPMYKGADFDSKDARKAILQDLVRVVLLSQEAKKRGLDKDTQVMEALKDYERTVLVQKLVQDEANKALPVGDDEIKDFYDKNPQMFTEPGRLTVSEIVVENEQAANDAMKSLLDGQAFESVATMRSVGETKANGGSLGEVIPVPTKDGQVKAYKVEEGKQPVEVKRFSAYWQKAVSMTPSDDAAKVKASDGMFYIIKIKERKEPKPAELNEELKKQIKEALSGQKEGKNIESIADGARASATITVNEDLL
jgi:EpsD family peptidyl-prolyl cis-trans isomerase